MLNTKDLKQKDRYRIVYCEPSFYTDNQNTFKIWKNLFKNLTLEQKTIAWTVGLCLLRRPNDWFCGVNKNYVKIDILDPFITIDQIISNTPIKANLKVNPETDILTFIQKYKVKAVPDAVFITLNELYHKNYPLQIIKGEISPIELLALQTQSQRVLAFNEDFSTWTNSIQNGRDYLGFLIHDLIHAHHFFSETEHKNGQLGFYRFIYRLTTLDDLTDLLNNPVFKQGFEYIISDMNAHPVHLFKTLHSLLFINLKNDVLATKIWIHWITQSDFLPSEITSLSLVNQSEFNFDHATSIQNLCQKLATN